MKRYFDIDRSRSYSSEQSLDKALVKMFGEEDAKRAVVVCNRTGRFTAVFPRYLIADGDLCRFGRKGFITLG